MLLHQAAERHGIELTWSTEVLDVLADGYNIRYGARSLKHEVSEKYYNTDYSVLTNIPLTGRSKGGESASGSI